MGVLAPEGTTWAKSIDKIADEIEAKTKKQVKLKVYYGGKQGDEPFVLRKIRDNILQGGIFTGRVLGDIYGSTRLMEVPFTFAHNQKLASHLLEKMEETFNKGISKNGFKNLGFIELGPVYLVLTKEAKSLEELKGVKIWAWQGDPLSSTFIKNLNFTAVPLALPDVLSSLSTGIIEATYAPPLAITAVQWNTKTKFLVDYPVTFSIGAFLLSNKSWNKVSKENQKIIEEIVSKHLKKANKETIGENQEALQSMKLVSKMKFLKFKEEDLKQGAQVKESVIKDLTGTLFEKEVVKEFEEKLKSLKK